MPKSRINTFIENTSQAGTNDPRQDPDASAWYFPGHGPNQIAEATPFKLENGTLLPDDEMINLLDEGIAASEQELTIKAKGIGSVALGDIIQQPGSLEKN